MIGRGLLLCALFARAVCPQSLSPDLPPGTLLGAYIRARAQQQFAHIPEYTCLETIDRFNKGIKRNAVEKQIDTVRLEVLLAGDREYFDSPGGRHFKEADPTNFITHGMIGSGAFATHAKGIFDNGLFHYRGEEELGGRQAARFDFQVPSLQSSYTVVVAGAQATVGVAGTFWADPATYELIRLEVDGTDIPPILQTSKLVTTVDYALTPIGANQMLLPQKGDMLMVRDSGEVFYDRFDFTRCHAYEAESAVSFAAGVGATSAVVAPKRPQPPGAMPPGLTVMIALTTPLTERSVVGDLVEGKIVQDLKSRGGVIFPGGSAVQGRVREMEKFPDPVGYSIGIEFTDIEVGQSSLRFFAEMQSVDALPGLQSRMTLPDSKLRPAPTTPAFIKLPDLPGVGFLFMQGDHFTIPAGFHMLWKTRSM